MYTLPIPWRHYVHAALNPFSFCTNNLINEISLLSSLLSHSITVLAEKKAIENTVRKEMLMRRLEEAEDILITGAKCLKVNGRYSPHGQEESGDWPVYQHVINQDLFLVYVHPEWLVQSNIDRFRDEESRKEIEAYNTENSKNTRVVKPKRPSLLDKLRKPLGTRRGSSSNNDFPEAPPQRISKAYVRMVVDPPSFPFHRDKSGGIVEFVDWMGGLWEKKGPSEIKVTTYDQRSHHSGEGQAPTGDEISTSAVSLEMK